MNDSDLIQFFRLDPPGKDNSLISNTSTWARGRVLGEGSFGIVWLETHTLTASTRAVKQIKNDGKPSVGKLNQELLAMTRLSRPQYVKHFAQFFGWYEEGPDLFLAMEYFELGDLRKHMKPAIPLPEAQSRDIILQLLTGLDVMHKDGFAHRDLKPENIFVLRPSPQWRVKIGDFGIAKRSWDSDTLLRSRSGTLPYMAPEIFQWVDSVDDDEFQYTQAVDVWSVSIMLFEFLVGQRPFSDERALKKYCDGRLEYPERLLKRYEVTFYGCQLAQELLSLDPRNRPSAIQSLSRPWFANAAIRGERALDVYSPTPNLAWRESESSNSSQSESGSTQSKGLIVQSQFLTWSDKQPVHSLSSGAAFQAGELMLVPKDGNLEEAIWSATSRRDLETVAILLRHGAPANSVRNCPLPVSNELSIFAIHEPITLLGAAVSLYDIKIAKLLLKQGVDPNVTPVFKGKNNDTLLHFICKGPWEKIPASMVRLLCKYGAKTDVDLLISAISSFGCYAKDVGPVDNRSSYRDSIDEVLDLLDPFERCDWGIPRLLKELYLQQHDAPSEPVMSWLAGNGNRELNSDEDYSGEELILAFSSDSEAGSLSRQIDYLRAFLDIRPDCYTTAERIEASENLTREDKEKLKEEVRLYRERYEREREEDERYRERCERESDDDASSDEMMEEVVEYAENLNFEEMEKPKEEMESSSESSSESSIA